MHLRSKGKGPEGNQPAPGQAGRPYLNKPGMPGWERGEEEEEEEAWKRRKGKEPLTRAGAPANKYQHFLNDLQRLISCVTDGDIYEQLFLCGVTLMSMKSL